MISASLTYPAILFDLDGTLVMSLEQKMQNAADLWKMYYGVSKKVVLKEYRNHSGIPREQLFQKIATKVLGRCMSTKEYIAFSDLFTKRNIKTLSLLPFVPEATTLLRKLVEVGVVVGISSSATQVEVEQRVKAVEEHRYFHLIMGSDGSFGKGVPHINHFSSITGVEPFQILMVGDEPNDLILAREAGAKAALVGQTRRMDELRLYEPDILVANLNELNNYLLQQKFV